MNRIARAPVDVMMMMSPRPATLAHREGPATMPGLRPDCVQIARASRHTDQGDVLALRPGGLSHVVEGGERP